MGGYNYPWSNTKSALPPSPPHVTSSVATATFVYDFLLRICTAEAHTYHQILSPPHSSPSLTLSAPRRLNRHRRQTPTHYHSRPLHFPLPFSLFCSIQEPSLAIFFLVVISTFFLNSFFSYLSIKSLLFHPIFDRNRAHSS